MALKPCRQCGEDVEESVRHCPHCGVGRPVSDASKAKGGKLQPCKSCGHMVSTNAKACPNCGAPTPLGQWDAAGGAMTGLGCLLTVLVTIPIAILFMSC